MESPGIYFVIWNDIIGSIKMSLHWRSGTETLRKTSELIQKTQFLLMLSMYAWLRVVSLTHKWLEMGGCILSIVATDVLVLKHQAISIHCAELIITGLDQFHTEILQLQGTVWENEIAFWEKILRCLRVNSSPPRSAYMHQWTRSPLIQLMVCRLFSAKPLPEPMLLYCQLASW